MAKSLESIAEYWNTQGNTVAENLFRNLAASQRKSGLPEALPSSPEDNFQELRSQYIENPNNPNLIARIQRAWYKLHFPETKVPDLAITQEEIPQFIKGIRGEKQEGGVMYYDKSISLARIDKAFPELASFSVREGTPIVSDDRTGGYLYVETDIDSPNRNTTEQELSEYFNSQGRFRLREEVYVLSSLFNKDVYGSYFDQGSTWSRLLGSRDGGLVVAACFGSRGRLGVRSHLSPRYRSSDVGGRSEGVLQKA